MLSGTVYCVIAGSSIPTYVGKEFQKLAALILNLYSPLNDTTFSS